MEVDQRRTTVPWRWPLLVSVVLLNVSLPSLVLSYGTLLVHSVSHGLQTWHALYTPTIFILTYSLSQCWCRDAADSWGGNVGYRLMATLGLLLVVMSLFLCAFLPYNLQPFIYGIFGGLGSSLISAQVDAVIFDTYDTRLGIVKGLSFIGQAIGQATFPHIITALCYYYGYSMSFIVLSGIMLQSLPALMFLKPTEVVKRPTSYSRYSDLAKTYAIFDNDPVNKFYSNELQLNDLSKSWKSPDTQSGDIELDIDYGDNDSVNIATITPPPSPEEKRRNMFGVEILPEIPEESEHSDEYSYSSDDDEPRDQTKSRKSVSVVIKRLSTLGDNFDEYIEKQSRRDSEIDSNHNRDFKELDITYEHIAPITEIRREKVFNSFSFRCQSAYASLRRKIWMPSYRVYRLKRRLSHIIYKLNDTFVKPLTRSLSCWRFYPALLLSFSRMSLMSLLLTLLPLINLEIKPKISMIETNFMMSLHGFTWLCFLLSTPWLAQTPKRNFKYVALFGLFVSAAACYLIAEANTHDAFSMGCVVAGLGFGALTSCWETAAQDFVGAHKWTKIHSTLETLSAICAASFVFGLSFLLPLEDSGDKYFIFILGLALSTVSFIWLIIAVVSIYVAKMRSFRLKQNWLF